MRRSGKTLLVGVALLLVTVDPVAACRFRLFRRSCRVQCYSYCTPCRPVAGCDGSDAPVAAPAAAEDYTPFTKRPFGDDEAGRTIAQDL